MCESYFLCWWQPEQGNIMAKGQQNNNKMVKKPKKDTSPPKPVTIDPVRATVVTAIPLRGKAAKLQK